MPCASVPTGTAAAVLLPTRATHPRYCIDKGHRGALWDAFAIFSSSTSRALMARVSRCSIYVEARIVDAVVMPSIAAMIALSGSASRLFMVHGMSGRSLCPRKTLGVSSPGDIGHLVQLVVVGFAHIISRVRVRVRRSGHTSLP